MPSGVGGNGDVSKLIKLHHRRRGWAWAGFGSLIGLVVYVVIGVMEFNDLYGAALTASYVPVFVLFIIAVVGIIAVLVDTVRLRSAGRAERDAARGKVVHAGPHRYPPKHSGSWAAGIVALVALSFIAVIWLPAEVDGAAYLMGAERQATFHAVSHSRDCGRGGCSTVTDGYLSGSPTVVELKSDIPLGATRPGREPLWNWALGQNLISGNGDAAGMLGMGLFFDVPTAFLFYGLVTAIRDRRSAARARRGGQ